MKINSQRDGDAKHAHDVRLSRTPVTMGSTSDDGYKLRYENAMGLLYDTLGLASSLSMSNLAAHRIAQRLIERADKLRDSE